MSEKDEEKSWDKYRETMYNAWREKQEWCVCESPYPSIVNKGWCKKCKKRIHLIMPNT